MKIGSEDRNSEEDAYELGRRAFTKGASSDNNPLPQGDRRCDDWAHGFMDAQKIRSDQHRPGHPAN